MADTTLYKQIALEWGQDTDSHLWGMGYSPDNGEHFYVLNTTYGRKYRQEDGDRIWPFLNDKVDGTVSKQVAEQQTVITSAVAQADSAVAYANDAIEKSRVNQQAIEDINSALSDAVSDAAVARSDGLRAWEAAQSNVDLIDSNYASASAAISSARAEAIAAADEAKASASAAGQDITTLKSQAGQFEQEMADAKGDISMLQATATGFKNTLTDTQGNVSVLQSDVTGLKKTTSDHAGNIATLQADAKTLASKMSSVQGDISTLQQTAKDTDAKITANSTAIEQNKKAIALKADEETVNKTNGDVAQLKAQLKVQADQIAAKVSSSDLDAKGYATQTYTQTQIKQTADSWNASLTSVKDGLTDKYTNLHATVDGIQAQVYNSDGSSKITLLSNLIATKVSQGDYNAQITLLENDIDLRVAKGDVISQINQEAGGNTLIRVSDGKGSLILDAGNTIVTGKAWIPSAAIANLTADDIKTGTLTGSTVHLGDSNGNTIDLGVLGTDHVGLHSSAKNGDQTYIDYNGIKNSGTGYSTTISQGKITTGYMTVNGGGLIDFRSSGNGTTIDSQNIKFYNSNAVNGGIEFSGGSPLATVRDGTVGNELRVRYDRSFALTPITDESARICASSAAMQVGFVQSGSSTPDRQTTGLWVDGDKRHVNLGVWGTDSTWARVEANTHNIHMQADKAHAWLSSDNVFRIYKDGDSSSTAIKLQVDGWAWVNGWVEAAGHGQHSALSTKTEIQPVDDDKMLKMVNDTDLATFLYKTDVANGETHRHIGLIIDDVHDVAQYQTPQEFIAPNGVSRDDDNMIGALFGAVKALTKRIKTLESKVG